MILAIRILGIMLVAATALPLMHSGSWLVRLWDFPRLQLAVLCGLTFVACAIEGYHRGWRLESTFLTVALGAATFWHLILIAPYTPIWTPEVSESGGSDLRLVVINLDVRNQEHEAMRRMIRSVDADVVLLIELDKAWHHALADLRTDYAEHIEQMMPDGLGMALWSRLPVEDASVRFVVSRDRPSIRATIRFPDGRATNLIAVHPTPPALERRHADGRHDSRIRDAELVLVAREVGAEPEASWIVAGDFNDVAWSPTTRLFRKLSGLRDPRIGRGFYNTYHAEYRLWRYPIDHVFVSPDFAVHDIRRVKAPGSDHFAVVADLDRLGPAPQPVMADTAEVEEAERLVHEGIRDAKTNQAGQGAPEPTASHRTAPQSTVNENNAKEIK